MNNTNQIDDLENRGFRRDQAEIILLMKQAAVTLFQDFPAAFVLFGGASLVLLYDSVRQSNDVDLLSTISTVAFGGAIGESLRTGVEGIGESLNIGPLSLVVNKNAPSEVKVIVNNRSGLSLFRVDLNRMGSVIQAEIEEHEIELAEEIAGKVKSVSRDFLLLQKAEAFLQRRQIKARDAWDIHWLLSAGGRLNERFGGHLFDSPTGEVGGEGNRERAQQT